MRWLLRAYPRVWRERYEEEMLALLEEHKVTPMTVVDLLGGALDAHFNYMDVTEEVMGVANRLRSGIVMIFCAFMLFGVGWAMLERINDPTPYFQAANRLYPEFGVLHSAVFVVGCIAFLAFMVGGLPIFFVAVKRAMLGRKQDVLIPFGIAVCCLLFFVFSTVVIGFWRPEHQVYAYLVAYLALSALLLVVGTVAVSFVIARTDFQMSELKLVYIPEIAILFGMVASVVLSIILIIAVISHAPQLLTTQDVSGTTFVTAISLMTLGMIFAAMGLKRGVSRFGGGLKTLCTVLEEEEKE